MQTFVINLERDGRRREWMHRQIEAAQLSAEFIKAVEGAKPPARFWPLLPPAGLLTAAEIGCYCSHLDIYHRIIDSNIEYALILEDDLEISGNFGAHLDDFQIYEMTWDIVKLSGNVKGRFKPIAPIGSGLELVCYDRIPLGAGAYLISNAGARKFVMWINAHGIRSPIDRDLRLSWSTKMTVYGLYPPPIRQDALPSTIDSQQPRQSKRSLLKRLRQRGPAYLVDGLRSALSSPAKRLDRLA